MTAAVTAGAGFLLAVLWFDLMFDVQARRSSGDDRALPEAALASIAGYYARVTTAARPMNRLIALVMAATLVAAGVQLVREDVPVWVSVASIALLAGAVTVAAVATVPKAVRLGTRADPIGVQSRLAGSILRDHLICFGAIAALIVIQLGFAI
ncbi:MAG: hypothetical protein ACRDK1_01900 [Solirubrobacterales bacterium]